VVILKDDWVLSDVRTGDIVNVIGPFITSEASSPPTPSTATITSRANYIILHPDILFPATSISNAWQCSRRPLIASLISTKAEVTPSLVWGNMLHEVMQTCLSEGRWEKKFVEEQIDDVVKTGLHSLVKIGFGLESAKEELRTKAKGLAAFSERFVGEEPKVILVACLPSSLLIPPFIARRLLERPSRHRYVSFIIGDNGFARC
jgi:DNA replication ATP-dependent helicase Dna2